MAIFPHHRSLLRNEKNISGDIKFKNNAFLGTLGESSRMAKTFINFNLG